MVSPELMKQWEERLKSERIRLIKAVTSALGGRVEEGGLVALVEVDETANSVVFYDAHGRQAARIYPMFHQNRPVYVGSFSYHLDELP